MLFVKMYLIYNNMNNSVMTTNSDIQQVKKYEINSA